MKVFLHNTSVFDVKAEAVVLPIDFIAKDLGGNLVRQAEKLLGDDWMDVVPELQIPYINGKTQIVEINKAGLPFKFLVFAGTLSHLLIEDELAIMTSAFDEACEWTGRMTIRGLATPLLTGGWRVTPVDALHRMLAIADFHKKGEVHIAIPDKDLYAMARPIVGSE